MKNPLFPISIAFLTGIIAASFPFSKTIPFSMAFIFALITIILFLIFFRNKTASHAFLFILVFLTGSIDIVLKGAIVSNPVFKRKYGYYPELEYLLKTEAVQFTPLGNNLRLHPRGVNWKTTSGLVLVKAYFSGEKTFEYGDKVLLKEKLSLPRFGKIKTKFKIKSHRKLSNVATNHEDRPFRVEIIRSEKRRRTISARLVKDIMYVYAPAKISDTELKNTIDSLKRRLKKKKLKHNIDRTSDLKTIAERINREYFNGGLKIKSIEYSTNQLRSFGCCNYKTQRIRISHRLWQMPAWVQDYVILHEMAHLIEPNHSKSFWDIVFQYKLTERAKGYLMAKGFDSEEESGGIEPVEL